MCNVEQVTVCRPCRPLTGKLDNASSAFSYFRERVADDSFTLLALEVTTEADFARDTTAGFLFSEENEERSSVRFFDVHYLVFMVVF